MVAVPDRIPANLPVPHQQPTLRGFPANAGWYIVEIMETLSASIGFVGILLGALLLWIRSDIKDIRSNIRDVRSDIRDVRSDIKDTRSDINYIRTNLKKHGERIVRIETVVVPPPRTLRETETGHAIAG